MTASLVTLPFSYYPNPTIGRPVFNGKCFIAEPGTAAVDIPTSTLKTLTTPTGAPLANPFDIGPGGVATAAGVSTEVMSDGNFAMLVQDSQQAQVYYVADRFAGVPVTEPVEHPFDSVADLRTNTNPASSYARTTGYYAKGDGGGALYKKNPVSVAADEGFLVFVDSLGGRWERIFEEGAPVCVVSAGADPTGVVASHDHIKTVVNYASDNRMSATLGGGNFLVTQTMGFLRSAVLMGPGKITGNIPVPARTGLIVMDSTNGTILTSSSVSFKASDNSINITAGSFSFSPGDIIFVDVGSKEHRGTYQVVTATALKLVVKGRIFTDLALGNVTNMYKQYWPMLSGFEIDAQGTGGSVTVLQGSDNITFRDLKFRNAFFSHVLTDSSSLLKVRYRNLHFDNCHGFVSGLGDVSFGDGLRLVAAEDASVVNCIMEGFTRVGFLTEGQNTPQFNSISPRFKNCEAKNVSAAPSSGSSGGESVAGFWVERTKDALIEGCTAKNLVNTLATANAYAAVTNGSLKGLGDGLDVGHTIRDFSIENVYIGVQKSSTVLDGVKFSGCHVGVLANSGGEDFVHNSRTMRNLQFSNMVVDIERAAYYSGGSAAPASCLVMLNGGGYSTVEIDGFTVEGDAPTGFPEYADFYIGKPSSFPTYGPITTVAFNATTRTITDTSATLAPLKRNDVLTVAGSTAGDNDHRYVVKEVVTASGTTTVDVASEDSGPMTTQAAGASITITELETYKKIIIKNAKTAPDRKLTLKTVDHRTVLDIEIENCPMAHALGSEYEAWERISFTKCDLSTEGSPAHGNFVKANAQKYVKNKNMWGMRPLRQDADEVNIRISGNELVTDNVVAPQSNSRVYVSNNRLYNFNGSWFTPDASVVTKGSFFQNELVNNTISGKLVKIGNVADVIVVHSTVQTDVTSPDPFVITGGGIVKAANNESGV